MHHLKEVFLGFVGLGIFLCAIFFLMLGPQIGFAFFIKHGGGPMLLPILALILVGYMTVEAKAPQFRLGMLAVIIIWMANMRGFYWDIFPEYSATWPSMENGDGFFTLNRISANFIFALCLAVGCGHRAWRKREDRHAQARLDAYRAKS